MISFYEWLKENRAMPHNAKEVKVYAIVGPIDMPTRKEELPLKVSKEESAMLIKLERYLATFPQVTDSMLAQMLDHKKLGAYKKFFSEYVPADGGIASDIREHGWYSVARYIAHNRNIKDRMKKSDNSKIL